MDIKDNEVEKKHRTLAAEYQLMKQDRQPYLDKAKVACTYTLPSLIADRDTKKIIKEC